MGPIKKRARVMAAKPAKRLRTKPVKAVSAMKLTRPALAMNLRIEPGKATSNRMPIAMGTAVLAVLSGSIVWLALFDRATAVPNRQQRDITIESLIDAQVGASRAADRNNLPLIANIAGPKTNPMADSVPAVERNPAAEQKPVAGREPAGVNQFVAPGKPERATARHSRQRAMKLRGRANRDTRHRASADASDAMPATGATDGNTLIAEARRYLGTNPTGRGSLWCGAFMDMVLKRTGHRGGGNLARAYAKYGTRISGPQVGAIVVLARNGGGHVGVVSGIDSNGNPTVISGNHNRRVAESTYPRGRVIAYVMPNS